MNSPGHRNRSINQSRDTIQAITGFDLLRKEKSRLGPKTSVSEFKRDLNPVPKLQYLDQAFWKEVCVVAHCWLNLSVNQEGKRGGRSGWGGLVNMGQHLQGLYVRFLSVQRKILHSDLKNFKCEPVKLPTAESVDFWFSSLNRFQIPDSCMSCVDLMGRHSLWTWSVTVTKTSKQNLTHLWKESLAISGSHVGSLPLGEATGFISRSDGNNTKRQTAFCDDFKLKTQTFWPQR